MARIRSVRPGRDSDVTVREIVKTPDGRIELMARVRGHWSRDEIDQQFDRPVMLERRKVRYPHGERDFLFWRPSSTRDGTVNAFGGSLPPGTEVVMQRSEAEDDLFWPLESVPVIVGRDLVDARAMVGSRPMRLTVSRTPG